MSFMRLTCPWCGTQYTFGIAGGQMIGSGHTCDVQKPCVEDGCENDSLWAVAPPGSLNLTNPSFVCGDHVEGWTLWMARGSSSVSTQA